MIHRSQPNTAWVPMNQSALASLMTGAYVHVFLSNRNILKEAKFSAHANFNSKWCIVQSICINSICNADKQHI